MSDSQALSDRYEVRGLLGEGGMGAVYRAFDRVQSRDVALKRLVVNEPHRRKLLTTLFEREFHTLAQLEHPAVIEVFDYGVDAQGPYYTMELLEGDDLGNASLEAEELCGVLYDVASSLALLHARRLVHRDVTRSNIRVVEAGRGKLIDFGALAPMGAGEQLVGTPTYVAPEAVLMQPLDGRADLYALGVVLYRALTGQYPYSTRSIRGLREAWRVPPHPPHEISAEFPRALSDLAMSLISLDRDLRPRDAAEVMERLAAIGSLDRSDAGAASHAYLVTPMLVGRKNVLERIREGLVGTLSGQGVGFLFSGPPGVGRSRMLEATALEAKVLGTSVLKMGTPTDSREDFSALDSLLGQLDEEAWVAASRSNRADGEVDVASGDRRSHRMREARERIVSASRRRAVIVIADDVHLLDDPSLATLASLLHDAASEKISVFASVPDDALSDESLALSLLRQRSRTLSLEPLEEDADVALVRSVFGKTSHVDHVGKQIHRVSRGFPRDSIALAEHLVARGIISYDAGAFSIPEALDVDDLPTSLAGALKSRVDRLSPGARSLALALALSRKKSMSLDECRRVAPDADSGRIFRALDELVAGDIVRFEGADITLRHEGFRSALSASSAEDERAAQHRALARALEMTSSDELARGYHLMKAGDPNGPAAIAEFARDFKGEGGDVFALTELDATDLGWLFSTAFDALRARGSDSRTLGRVRYFIMTLGVFGDARWFFEARRDSELELRRDAGHLLWEASDPEQDSMARLYGALAQAGADYEANPDDHLFPPAEAIRHLVQYVVAAIAVGARTADGELRRGLPRLLEPFAPLSPAVEAMKENSRSAAESTYADYENAARRLEPVVQALGKPEAAAMEHAGEIRAACIYAIAAYRARMGVQDAASWLDEVADHPRHASNVMRTRALLALHRGDWDTADAFQKAAEQYDVEHDQRQLFGRAGVSGEVDVYARGLDLARVKERLLVMAPLAERYPGWRPPFATARAEHAWLRGDLEKALSEFDSAAAASLPKRAGEHPDAAFYSAEAGSLEVLLELGRVKECLERGLASLRHGDAKATGARYDRIERAVAIAQARRGDCDGARSRLGRVIEHRKTIGCSGLMLGLLYEAMTMVEVYREDLEAAEAFYELTRGEYVDPRGVGFARRLDRLRRLLGEHGRDRNSVLPRPRQSPEQTAERAISKALSDCDDASTRAIEGLAVLVDAAGATEGHLYLLGHSGLRLAASSPGLGPPSGLSEYLRNRIDVEFGALKTEAPLTMITATVNADADELLGPLRAARDADQLDFHPVWIRAGLGGHSTLVGVFAAGLAEGAAMPTRVHQVARALGDALVRTGDSTVADARSPGITSSGSRAPFRKTAQ